MALFLTASKCSAQIKYATMFLAGASEGLNETLLHHYSSFEKKLPGADPQYWNPEVSWSNKYHKNYPFASTLLVPLTDAYHLNKLVYKGLILGSVTISIGERKPLKGYLKDFILCSICYSSGFYLVYGLIF